MGHYTAYYRTAAQARQASGTLSASVSRAGVSGSGEVAVSSEVAKTSGHYDTRTQYNAYGWNQDDKLPPKVRRSSSLELTTGSPQQCNFSFVKSLGTVLQRAEQRVATCQSGTQ